MTTPTPKLKLHSLHDERPNTDQPDVLVFYRVGSAGVSAAVCADVHAASSKYIQVKSASDKDRFFVTCDAVGKFLIKHNLLEFPTTSDHEALTYNQAAIAWCKSYYSKADAGHYNANKEAFVEDYVSSKGVTFTHYNYKLYCC
jgi:hypothetical protein